MTADNQPGKETSGKGEVRPSPNKDEKLENKIADEKDNELLKPIDEETPGLVGN